MARILTAEDIKKTIKGERCSYCGNLWELKRKCTTCGRDKDELKRIDKELRDEWAKYD